YVANAARLWEELSPEMALRTLSGIYPAWDLSEETDRQVAELIEAADTPAGLRRTLREGRDRVARAKAAQASDAEGRPATWLPEPAEIGRPAAPAGKTLVSEGKNRPLRGSGPVRVHRWVARMMGTPERIS